MSMIKIQTLHESLIIFPVFPVCRCSKTYMLSTGIAEPYTVIVCLVPTNNQTKICKGADDVQSSVVILLMICCLVSCISAQASSVAWHSDYQSQNLLNFMPIQSTSASAFQVQEIDADLPQTFSAIPSNLLRSPLHSSCDLIHMLRLFCSCTFYLQKRGLPLKHIERMKVGERTEINMSQGSSQAQPRKNFTLSGGYTLKSHSVMQQFVVQERLGSKQEFQFEDPSKTSDLVLDNLFQLYILLQFGR